MASPFPLMLPDAEARHVAPGVVVRMNSRSVVAGVPGHETTAARAPLPMQIAAARASAALQIARWRTELPPISTDLIAVLPNFQILMSPYSTLINWSSTGTRQ